MSERDSPAGCSRRTADIGLGVAIIGGLLVFGVPGGLWSDVPGWTMLILGGLTDVAFTGAYLAARKRPRR